MIDVGQNPEFFLQAVERGGIELPQRLERHDRVSMGIERLVDDAEAAFSEASSQVEPTTAFHGEGGWSCHGMFIGLSILRDKLNRAYDDSTTGRTL